MKKFLANQIGTLVVIGLVMVMSIALALTLKGKMLQGNLRGAAPVIYNITANRPAQANLNNIPFKPNIPYKPYSVEPNPINSPITRGNFIRLVVEQMLKPATVGTNDNCFLDTKGHPDGYYICYAASVGLVDTSQINFRPNDPLNRAEALKTFIQALGASNYTGNATYYLDVPQGAWYYQYINRGADLKINDILPGPTSNFYPATLLTNGRAQYMIQNMKKAGLIS